MKKIAYWGVVFLLGSALGVYADDDAWHVKADRGETVKVLPPHARVPSDAGQPVFAPLDGASVYKASYGAGTLIDHGGLEIANAGYVQIYYSNGAMPAGVTTAVNNFVGNFGSGVPDYTIVQQYGSHAPIAATLANGGQLFDSNPVPSSISDGQIQSYIAGLFTAGRLTASASTIYGVYLPPGTKSTAGSSSSCTNYCGYHSVFGYGGKQIKYAVYPYPNCSGCSISGLTPTDMLTIVSSHEIREAVTDPGDNGSNAWYDRRGYEADDKCAWHHLYQMARGGAWVQPEYSNRDGGCVVP